MASIRYDSLVSGNFAAACALTAAVVARHNVREHPALVKFALQDAPAADEEALAAARGELRLEKTANLVMRLVRGHPELRASGAEDISAASPIPLVLVKTHDETLAALAALAAADPPVIAIDIEHHSAHTSEGFVALLQASTPREDFLFDTMVPAVRDALREGLGAVLGAPLPLKVFHGAANDVRWLATDFGVRIGASFVDTHEVAVAMGWTSLSLKALVRRLLRRFMSKEEQSGDWRRRPLTPAMQSYARGDTRLLLPMAMRMLAVAAGVLSEEEVACDLMLQALLPAGHTLGSARSLFFPWRVVVKDVDGSFLSYSSVALASRMVRQGEAEWELNPAAAEAATQNAVSRPAAADGAAGEDSAGGYVEPVVRRLLPAEGHDAADDPMVTDGFAEGRCCGCGARPKGLAHVHLVPAPLFHALGPAVAAFNHHDRAPLCKACSGPFRKRRNQVLEELARQMGVPTSAASLERTAAELAGPGSMAAAAAAALVRADSDHESGSGRVKKRLKTAGRPADGQAADGEEGDGAAAGSAAWGGTTLAPPAASASAEEEDDVLRAPATDEAGSPGRLAVAAEAVCRPVVLAALRGVRSQRVLLRSKLTPGRPLRSQLLSLWEGPRPMAVQPAHLEEYDWLSRCGAAPLVALVMEAVAAPPSGDEAAAASTAASTAAAAAATAAAGPTAAAARAAWPPGGPRLSEADTASGAGRPPRGSDEPWALPPSWRAFDAQERDSEAAAREAAAAASRAEVGRALDSPAAAWVEANLGVGGHCMSVGASEAAAGASEWVGRCAALAPRSAIEILRRSGSAVRQLVWLRGASAALRRLDRVDGEQMATLPPGERDRQRTDAAATVAVVTDKVHALAHARRGTAGLGRALRPPAWGAEAEALLEAVLAEEQRVTADVVAKVAGAAGPSTQPPLMQALPMGALRRMSELIRFGPAAARGLERLSPWYREQLAADAGEEERLGASGLSVAAERRATALVRLFRALFVEVASPTHLPAPWAVDQRVLTPRAQWARTTARLQESGWDADAGSQ
ncbi:hypothetical protein FNF31_03034 [Cafeteria roenbergensis]|uniref:3'-5' exonuclease domain-containing protein n=1 Tax=Cafeteria roenbergensis TaxID=33653 RepID=A0A5A8DCP9_CAFRO|nr:hypothetical protein FNF31_03034 [Cafeteria roenbergensis]